MLHQLKTLVLSSPSFTRSVVANSFLLKTFSFFNVPFIFFAGARIQAITHERIVVRVPLNFLTKNHLKKRTMYFAVLAAGADCAAGYVAMRALLKSSKKIELVFQDFKADFLQKAQSSIDFTCHQVADILALVKNAEKSLERFSLPVKVVATDSLHKDPVAVFELTLTLKQKSGL